MSIILILSLFLIWMAWSPDGPLHTYFSPGLGLIVFAAGYVLLVLATGLWSRWLARQVAKRNMHLSVDRFNRVMMCARFAIPLWFGVGVFLLGWGQAVQLILGKVGHYPLELPGILLGLTPGLLAWMALWWSQFPADRALREQSFETQLENNLPVFAPSGFAAYFASKLRIQLLFTLVPVLMIICFCDIGTVGIMAMGRHWGIQPSAPGTISNTADTIIHLLAAGMVFLFAPVVLRRVLHTQPLPHSPLRERLEEMCRNTGMRCREILLWRTHNNMGNAAVMGILPAVRYVMISDLLLETMTDEQIEAVFAHEMGHVKHRHMLWYVVFFVTMFALMFCFGTLCDHFLHLSGESEQLLQLGLIPMCGLMFWLGFGYVSRWFERQADVYAARTMERSTALVHAGGIQDSPANQSDSVGMYGATVFASALERVAIVNNIPVTSPNWTHGSIANRMRYIRRLADDPSLTTRFDRKIRLVYYGLVFVLIISGIWAVIIVSQGDDNLPAPTPPPTRLAAT